MKFLILIISALFALVLPVCAEQFCIAGSGVSFDAPSGFTRLTEEEIALKYPSNRAPAFVVGNDRRTTSIAYDLKPQEFSAEKLDEAKTAFENLFQRIVAGLVWKDRKIITLQGQRWIYLEMTSQAIDTDIHNIMLVTSHKGKLLLFNFNSTRNEFPNVEAALRKSIKSIILKDI